jgi:hypothetical protein
MNLYNTIPSPKLREFFDHLILCSFAMPAHKLELGLLLLQTAELISLHSLFYFSAMSLGTRWILGLMTTTTLALPTQHSNQTAVPFSTSVTPIKKGDDEILHAAAVSIQETVGSIQETAGSIQETASSNSITAAVPHIPTGGYLNNAAAAVSINDLAVLGNKSAVLQHEHETKTTVSVLQTVDIRTARIDVRTAFNHILTAFNNIPTASTNIPTASTNIPTASTNIRTAFTDNRTTPVLDNEDDGSYIVVEEEEEERFQLPASLPRFGKLQVESMYNLNMFFFNFFSSLKFSENSEEHSEP